MDATFTPFLLRALTPPGHESNKEAQRQVRRVPVQRGELFKRPGGTRRPERAEQGDILGEDTRSPASIGKTKTKCVGTNTVEELVATRKVPAVYVVPLWWPVRGPWCTGIIRHRNDSFLELGDKTTAGRSCTTRFGTTLGRPRLGEQRSTRGVHVTIGTARGYGTAARLPVALTGGSDKK